MKPQTPAEWAFVITLALLVGFTLLMTLDAILNFFTWRRIERQQRLAARYADTQAGETR